MFSKKMTLNSVIYFSCLQLYSLGDEPDRREFLDEHFAFLNSKGKDAFEIFASSLLTVIVHKI